MQLDLFKKNSFGNLKNKIALVTGGSKGIGEAIAKTLIDNGCKVIITSKNEIDLKKTAKELKVEYIKADLIKLDEIDKLTKEFIYKYKNLNILVNNAGVAYKGALDKLDDDKIIETIDVNLKAILLLTKRFIPYINKGGTIINISSGLGKVGIANHVAYCASKFAVVGLTEALAKELDDIDVIAICPGSTNTDMIRQNYPDINPNLIDQPEDVAKRVLEAIKGRFKSGSAINV